jgi:hypothetical protein
MVKSVTISATSAFSMIDLPMTASLRRFILESQGRSFSGDHAEGRLIEALKPHAGNPDNRHADPGDAALPVDAV